MNLKIDFQRGGGVQKPRTPLCKGNRYLLDNTLTEMWLKSLEFSSDQHVLTTVVSSLCMSIPVSLTEKHLSL